MPDTALDAVTMIGGGSVVGGGALMMGLKLWQSFGQAKAGVANADAETSHMRYIFEKLKDVEETNKSLNAMMLEMTTQNGLMSGQISAMKVELDEVNAQRAALEMDLRVEKMKTAQLSSDYMDQANKVAELTNKISAQSAENARLIEKLEQAETTLTELLEDRKSIPHTRRSSDNPDDRLMPGAKSW